MFRNIFDYKIFTLFGLFFAGLNLLGIALTLGGVFYPAILAVYVLGGLLYFTRIIYKSKKGLFNLFEAAKNNWGTAAVAAVSLVFIAFLSFFTTPTVFSGRDQGSFSEAAIRLAQNHQLPFETPVSAQFFQIYGSGQALNFPGFDYESDGQLITQFPTGYISWLSAFYSFFGLNGFILANAVSLFLFLLYFYLFARAYLGRSASLTAFALTLTLFPVIWFFKATLSENLALFLLWFSLWEFASYLRNKKNLHFFSSFFVLSVLAFTRIEALAFLAVFAGLIFIRLKQSGTLKMIFTKKNILSAAILVFLFLANMIVNFEHYKVFLKGFLKSFLPDNPANTDQSSLLATLSFFMKIWIHYALIGFLLLGLIALIYLFLRRRWEIIFPFLIVAPSFIYLIHPGISFDHPWMLRRYLFSVLPMLVFFSVWILWHFLFDKKIFFYLACSLLLAGNLFVAFSYLTFSEHPTLLNQTQKLADQFQNNDLVLVDREATGDPWAMLPGPLGALFGKEAAYLPNPKDLKKINTNRFRNIYLIIPDSSLGRYAQVLPRLQKITPYSINSERLGVIDADRDELLGAKSVTLPPKTHIIVDGAIYQYQ